MIYRHCVPQFLTTDYSNFGVIRSKLTKNGKVERKREHKVWYAYQASQSTRIKYGI